MERNLVPPFTHLNLNRILMIIADVFEEQKAKVILAGGLAMIAYGRKDRHTYDLDAEVSVSDIKFIENAGKELKKRGIVADISDNISRWSMIDLPPDYQRRAKPYKSIKGVNFYLLSPVDLILSKLRVFREIDLEDAIYLMKRFNIGIDEIKRKAEIAISISPKSTEILAFKKNLKYFEEKSEKSLNY